MLKIIWEWLHWCWRVRPVRGICDDCGKVFWTYGMVSYYCMDCESNQIPF